MRRWLAVFLLVAAPVAAWLIDRQADSDDPEPPPEATSSVDPGQPVEPDQPSPVPGGENATARTVHDGDSFIAVLDGGQEVDVRMIGINAPEFGECQHRESRDALRQLLGSSAPIVLERDVTDRDQYGRLLRYVHANRVFTNVDMVERGLALVLNSGPDVAHQPALREAQQRARAEGLGMWNPNACGPAALTALRIVEVEEDPSGRDSANLNGELVVIHNGGETPVDMTGWKLRDDSTRNRFWFPEGFTLYPGRSVTVHVGRGENSEDALYWDRRSPVWDNSGDMALLLDSNANAVSVVDVPTG